MFYLLLADVLVAVHVAFVVFVILGGFLSARWRWVAWIHVPCAVWGALISFAGWICPLTPLEIRLRRAGGEEGYAGGFVEHYLVPVLYPDALTRPIQIGLGVFVLGINIVAYRRVLRGSPPGAGKGKGDALE